uniref:Glycosyltransferase n=1 Tax=Salix viminalis TaxID=40686 RepID=A0A6N2NBC8_SALVM
MMNLCKQLVSKNDTILITFVVTEEWFGLIGSDPNKPDRIRFATIPNVIPSEMVRSKDLLGFMEAVATKMGAPFERLLDQLEPPSPSLIVTDTFLLWAFDAGNQRNIPVASFWPLSALAFSLESQVIDALKRNLSKQIYPIGPAIPYFDLGDSSTTFASDEDVNYLRWLDFQPCGSVLYVSLGSFLPVSSAQMEEIAAGLCESGVRFLWVARGETERLSKVCGGKGLVARWCDQLRVLCHPSVGGFLSHCGWNSICEGVFAGLPFLTFPIAVDQFPNCKLIVEDWKIGLRVKEFMVENMAYLVTREKISGLVTRFMDLESNECPAVTSERVLCHPSVGGLWPERVEFQARRCFCKCAFPCLPNRCRLTPKHQVNSGRLGGDWRSYKRGNQGGLVQKFMDLDSSESWSREICEQEISKGGSSETHIKTFVNSLCYGTLAFS